MLRKTAIITGASGGIGGETAKVFAQNGYNVALTYFSHETKALEEELKAYNVEVKSFKLDQADSDSIRECIADIFASFEYVDAIVCNGGKAEKPNLLSERSDDEIDDILDTNLRGTILLNREIAKRFIAQKHGAIVNIASINGVNGSRCETVYSASKAGVIGLTKALACEVAPYGVRVNAIAPGFIETNMTKGLNEATRNEVIKRTPLGRLGEPEDIANLAYFLGCDKSSFITGECICATGGVLRF